MRFRANLNHSEKGRSDGEGENEVKVKGGQYVIESDKQSTHSKSTKLC